MRFSPIHTFDWRGHLAESRHRQPNIVVGEDPGSEIWSCKVTVTVSKTGKSQSKTVALRDEDEDQPR